MTSTTETIAVMTASSNSGAACVEWILSQPVTSTTPTLRALFRSESKATKLRQIHGSNPNLQILTSVDANDIPSMEKAFNGCTVVFLVTPSTPTGEIEGDAKLVDNMMTTAVKVGVKHIIFGASWTVNAADKLPSLSGRFKPGEQLLKKLQIENGIKWTVLRGGFFHGNFGQLFANLKQTDIIEFASMRIPSVDPRDMGRVAAAVAVNRTNHEQHVYEISGPEDSSMDDIVRVFAAVLERPITFKRIDVEQAVSNMPLYLKELFTYLAEGGKIPFSTDVKLVTGKDAVSLKEWVEENKKAFEKA